MCVHFCVCEYIRANASLHMRACASVQVHMCLRACMHTACACVHECLSPCMPASSRLNRRGSVTGPHPHRRRRCRQQRSEDLCLHVCIDGRVPLEPSVYRVHKQPPVTGPRESATVLSWIKGHSLVIPLFFLYTVHAFFCDIFKRLLQL